MRINAIGVLVLAGGLLLGWQDVRGQGDCDLPQPVNLDPHDGQVEIPLQPQLRVALSQGVFGPCQWVGTTWVAAYGYDDVANHRNLIFDVSTFEAARGRLAVPPGALAPGREVWWRTRLQFSRTDTPVANASFSDWSAPTRFTTTFVVDGRCAAMPAPYLLAPRFQASDVPLAPTLEIAVSMQGVAPPCRWEATQWQVSTDPGFRVPAVLDTVPTAGAPDPGRFDVPAGALQPLTTYYWRARTVSGEGTPQRVTSPWGLSQFVTGTVQGGGHAAPCTALPAPNALSPDPDAVVSTTPILEVWIPMLPDGCRHDETAWQLLDAATGEYVYQTGFTAAHTVQLAVPAGALEPGRRYLWRAKLRGLGVGPGGAEAVSEWSAERAFETHP